MHGIIKNTNSDYICNNTQNLINNRYYVTFEGILYNKDSLWNALSLDSDAAESTDIEHLIANLYMQLGDAFISHLNGSFALIIYDNETNVLWGATDRFGSRPVYYTNTADSFIYASAIRSILDCDGYTLAVNRLAVDKYMTKGYRTGSETMFERIYALPAGHSFYYKNGKLTISKYWKPVININTGKDSSAYTIDINNYISNAVNSVLDYCDTDNTNTCAFLEKDFMSSYMTAILRPDDSFSIHYDFDMCDENKYITELSNILRIDNVCMQSSTKQCIDAISNLTDILEEPIPLEDSLPAYMLCTNLSGRTDAVISGACGGLMADDGDINDKLSAIERQAMIYTKLSTANDIKLHLPYLNNHFFDAMCEIPNEYKKNRIAKNGKLISRNVFRQAASKYLSGYFTDRIHKKRVLPVAAWLRNEKYYNLFKNTLSSDAVCEYLDQTMLLKLLEAHKQGKADNSAILLRAYMFVLWYERFFMSEMGCD
ncbi:MAG: hypothetical protein IJB96_11030 [Lachnospira sp.]|nr:hypothetical protein [Lachnospira sp.]